MDDKLTQHDFVEIQYLVDSYGSKMWNADYVKTLLSRIRNMTPQTAQK